MNNRSLLICTTLSVSILIILIYLVSKPAQIVDAKAIPLSNQVYTESLDTRDPLKINFIVTEPITYTVYLPALTNKWIWPCGVIPFLISPPDGSHVTSDDYLALDGGYRGGGYDWLQIDYSRTSDFTTFDWIIHQPAGDYWVLEIWRLDLDPGEYYWRASVWCNGPHEFTFPPEGFARSPFSQVWRFKLDN